MDCCSKKEVIITIWMQLIPPLNVEIKTLDKCIEVLDRVFQQTSKSFS